MAIVRSSINTFAGASGTYDTGSTTGAAGPGLTGAGHQTRVSPYGELKLDPDFGTSGRVAYPRSSTFAGPSGTYDTGSTTGAAGPGLTGAGVQGAGVKILNPSDTSPPATIGLQPSAYAITFAAGLPIVSSDRMWTSSFALSFGYGQAQLVSIQPTGHPLPIQIGYAGIRIALQLRMTAAELALGFGAPAIHKPGPIAASHALSLDYSSDIRITQTPGIQPPAKALALGFGSAALAASSIAPASYTLALGFGAPHIGHAIYPPSGELALEPGAPSLVSPLRQNDHLPLPLGFGAPRIWDPTATFALYIGAELFLSFSAVQPFEIAMQGAGQSTLSFGVDSIGGTWSPTTNAEVSFWLAGERIFRGFVSSWEETAATGHPTMRSYAVHCNDVATILDRRVVYGYWNAEKYTAGAAFIANDIVSRFLDSHGIDLYQGPLATNTEAMQVLDLPPVTAREFFNRVSAETGFDWYMDGDLIIRFFDNVDGTGPAPFELDQSANNGDVLADSIRVGNSDATYRNVTFVPLTRAVPDFTEEATPYANFPSGPLYFVTYPIAAPPTVVVTPNPLGPNAGDPPYTATVIEGPTGVPTDDTWDFYYQPDQTYLRKNTIAPFQLSGHPDYVGPAPIIEVTYQLPEGLTAFARAEDSAQVAERDAREQGPGYWEVVENTSDAENYADAVAYAQQLNARFGGQGTPKTLEFQTRRNGLKPGQILTVNLTRPPLTGDFLIERVTASERNGSLLSPTPYLVYSVSATSTPYQTVPRPTARQAVSKASEQIEFLLAKTIRAGSANPGLTVGDDVTIAHYVILSDCRFAEAFAFAGSIPTGADVTLDIKLRRYGSSTWNSILANGAVVRIRDGESLSDFVLCQGRGYRRDELRVDVLTVGSDNPGADIRLAVRAIL